MEPSSNSGSIAYQLRDVGQVTKVFLATVSCFGNGVMLSSEWVRRYSLWAHIQRLQETVIISSLNNSAEFTGEPIWAQCFLLWEAINWKLNFLSSYRPIQIAYFLFDSWQIVSFKDLVRFIQVSKYVGREWFKMLLFHPFDVHGICINVPSFISEGQFFILLSKSLLLSLIFS